MSIRCRNCGSDKMRLTSIGHASCSECGFERMVFLPVSKEDACPTCGDKIVDGLYQCGSCELLATGEVRKEAKRQEKAIASEREHAERNAWLAKRERLKREWERKHGRQIQKVLL